MPTINYAPGPYQQAMARALIGQPTAALPAGKGYDPSWANNTSAAVNNGFAQGWGDGPPPKKKPDPSAQQFDNPNGPPGPPMDISAPSANFAPQTAYGQPGQIAGISFNNGPQGIADPRMVPGMDPSQIPGAGSWDQSVQGANLTPDQLQSLGLW